MNEYDFEAIVVCVLAVCLTIIIVVAIWEKR